MDCRRAFPWMFVFVVIAAHAAVLPLFTVPAAAQMGGMNFMNPSDFLKFLPPVISSVRHTPNNPRSDEETAVTARVGRISFGDDYEFLDSVTLFYSADGGESWEEIPMEQEDEKELNWVGYIPGFEDGVEVIYYVQARDSVGNIAMMMPPDLSMDPEWFSIIGEDPETGESPFDYLVKMYDHEDSPEDSVPSYFDIRAAYFGYDDDYLYFRYEFESKPVGGTISPIDINVYAMLLINTSLVLSPKMMSALRNYSPDRKPDMSFLESERGALVQFFSNLWLWYWAPLADIAPPIPDLGKLPGVSMGHIDPGAPGCPVASGASLANLGPSAIKCIRFEKNGWEYNINGNYLDVAVDRETVGPAKDDTVNFSLFNVRAVGPDIMNIKAAPGDVVFFLADQERQVATVGGPVWALSLLYHRWFRNCLIA